ncbi:MAG TPA: hypothetical protein VFF44_12000 [Casimicrobiaceae bacterium]|jgi:hypothetical protein|nr:hypothetical protein [Casimicrobiaceae bacterium]
MQSKLYEPTTPRALLAATAIATATVALSALVLLPAMLDNAHPDAGATAAQLASAHVGDATAGLCAAQHSPVAGRAPCTATFQE